MVRVEKAFFTKQINHPEQKRGYDVYVILVKFYCKAIWAARFTTRKITDGNFDLLQCKVRVKFLSHSLLEDRNI